MNCRCHNVAKVWQKDRRNKKGGYWRCRFKHVEFRLRNRPYVDKETTRRRLARREALVAQMNEKIGAMLEAHPFLRRYSVS